MGRAGRRRGRNKLGEGEWEIEDGGADAVLFTSTIYARSAQGGWMVGGVCIAFRDREEHLFFSGAVIFGASFLEPSFLNAKAIFSKHKLSSRKSIYQLSHHINITGTVEGIVDNPLLFSFLPFLFLFLLPLFPRKIIKHRTRSKRLDTLSFFFSNGNEKMEERRRKEGEEKESHQLPLFWSLRLFGGKEGGGKERGEYGGKRRRDGRGRWERGGWRESNQSLSFSEISAV